MPKRNRLSRAVGAINLLPRRLRSRSLTLLLGSQVRFAGTARVRIHELGQERAILSLKNRRPVQNHIKGIHAAAMALLAESASGFLVGMNVPDDKLPLIKTMKIDYLKRAQGDLTAIATLEAGQIEQIRQQDKGEVRVAVLVSDENGNQPIACEMVWAWVGKKPRVATAAPRQRTSGATTSTLRREPPQTLPSAFASVTKNRGRSPRRRRSRVAMVRKEEKPPCARPGEYSRFNAITDWARVITNKRVNNSNAAKNICSEVIRMRHCKRYSLSFEALQRALHHASRQYDQKPARPRHFSQRQHSRGFRGLTKALEKAEKRLFVLEKFTCPALWA